MKLKFFLIAFVAGLIGLGLYGCDNEEGTSLPTVPSEIETAFSEKYPGRKVAGWSVKDKYYVAKFDNDRYDAEAWFASDGNWLMTETDLPYDALPSDVKIAFEGSKYAKWQVDDVDKLERKDMETVYVIEVESGSQEMDLYYNVKGILVKEIPDSEDDSDDYLPSEIDKGILSFIEERYPGARIIETDREADFIEIDIIHEHKGKELLFTIAGVWISTSWDVLRDDVPSNVIEMVLGNYAGYEIDDIEYTCTQTENYYLFELEKGEQNKYVKVKEDGTILP